MRRLTLRQFELKLIYNSDNCVCCKHTPWILFILDVSALRTESLIPFTLLKVQRLKRSKQWYNYTTGCRNNEKHSSQTRLASSGYFLKGLFWHCSHPKHTGLLPNTVTWLRLSETSNALSIEQTETLTEQTNGEKHVKFILRRLSQKHFSREDKQTFLGNTWFVAPEVLPLTSKCQTLHFLILRKSKRAEVKGKHLLWRLSCQNESNSCKVKRQDWACVGWSLPPKWLVQTQGRAWQETWRC